MTKKQRQEGVKTGCPDTPGPETDKCSAGDDIGAVTAALEAKKRELDEAEARLLRLQADFDNFRRRSRQEKEELSQVVAGEVMTRLLPVLDNFERALASGPDQDAAQILAGVELINRQFITILEEFGLKPIDAVGVQFDPAFHEAVMRVEDDSQPDGMIVGELQKGYQARSRVLRPSMVKVVGNN